MPLAYPYIRWSSEKQSDGSSLKRQTEKAVEIAAKFGLTLADQSYVDPGVSAAKGKNIAHGALGTFIAAVKAGRIEKGSTLIVEDFDRLSRLPVMDALRPFQELLDLDIALIVDGKLFTKASLNSNWTDLIVALSKMDGAHSVNKMRAERVQKAWDNKLASVKTRKLTAMGPSWLRLVGKKPALNEPDKRTWEQVPDKVAIVQRVFELARLGHGGPTLAKRLNEEGVGTLGDSKFWTPGTVVALLRNEAVTGVYQQRGTMNRQTGYYPVIIKPTVFREINGLMDGRAALKRKPGKAVSNLFSGLLKCSCGQGMRFVNGNKAYMYVRCISAYSNNGCEARAHAYNPLEEELLGRIMITLSNPLIASDEVAADPTADLRAQIAVIDKRLANMYTLVQTAGDAAASGGFDGAVKLISGMEHDKRKLEEQIVEASKKTPLQDVFWQVADVLNRHEQEHKDGSPNLYETRLQLQGGLRRLISKIVLPHEPQVQASDGTYLRRAIIYGDAAGPLARDITKSKEYEESRRRRQDARRADADAKFMARMHRREDAADLLYEQQTARKASDEPLVVAAMKLSLEGATPDGGCAIAFALLRQHDYMTPRRAKKQRKAKADAN